MQSLPSPIAVFPPFIARQPETLRLSGNKKGSGGSSDYKVELPHGQLVFTIDGRSGNMLHDHHHTVRDPAGTALFILAEHAMGDNAYFCEYEDEKRFMEIKGELTVFTCPSFSRVLILPLCIPSPKDKKTRY